MTSLTFADTVALVAFAALLYHAARYCVDLLLVTLPEPDGATDDEVSEAIEACERR